ncbi:hypothetical protein TU73_21950 [Pseudomonas libanensis]|uniref:Transmembrane protein n=1 Tax=Pseudomonas libanensis TaxID=75588 RepID=A0A0R2Y2P3_9PSED|nr:hypothetical protein [Pseudomonas libanensis]KRP42679.1 hypothetical protein TU73_21950 [Pseudomonas libanensis]
MKKANKNWLGKFSDPKACVGGLVAVLAVLGSLNAQAASCPEPRELEHRVQNTPNGGVAIYTSMDGLWHGENPGDTTDYSDEVGFKNVFINSDSQYVACSYEGKGLFSAVRLSLRWNTGRAITPEGGEWTDNTCHAQEAKDCRFN